MNTYLSSRGCPKCGGKNTQDTYHPANRVVGEVVFPEHILRRCDRCAYRWVEAPIDQAVGEKT